MSKCNSYNEEDNDCFDNRKMEYIIEKNGVYNC